MTIKTIRKIIIGILFLILLAGGLVAPKIGQAEKMPISVKAILPDNQDSEASYFDLRMTSGQEQDLEVEVYNSSDKEVEIGVATNAASTNDNGVITYSVPKVRDESLKVSFEDIATTSGKIKIAANGTGIVKVHLKMPETSLDGIILGGIYLTLPKSETKDEAESSSKKAGMIVENEIAYSIGVKLTETDTAVAADMKLKKVFASQVMSRNSVKVNLQNPTSLLIDDITYHAKVFKKGSNEILQETSVIGYRMAPNTNFNLGINWENQKFTAGTYKLSLTARSEALDQEWSWKEEFKISADEAKKLNETAVDLEVDNTFYYILVGIGLLIVLILIIGVIVYLSKKKAARRRKKMAKRKKRKSSSRR